MDQSLLRLPWPAHVDYPDTRVNNGLILDRTVIPQNGIKKRQLAEAKLLCPKHPRSGLI